MMTTAQRAGYWLGIIFWASLGGRGVYVVWPIDPLTAVLVAIACAGMIMSDVVQLRTAQTVWPDDDEDDEERYCPNCAYERDISQLAQADAEDHYDGR